MNHIEATIQCGTAREICEAICSCEDETEYPRLGINFAYDIETGLLDAWQRSERWAALVEAGKELHLKIINCSHRISPIDDFLGKSEEAKVAAAELYAAVWAKSDEILGEPNERIRQAMRVLEGGWSQVPDSPEYGDVVRREQVIVKFETPDQRATLLIDGRYFESYGETPVTRILSDLATIGRLCGLLIITDSIEKELL